MQQLTNAECWLAEWQVNATNNVEKCSENYMIILRRWEKFKLRHTRAPMYCSNQKLNLLPELTNVNTDDVSTIGPWVDISIKTSTGVVTRLIDTLLRAVAIVHLTFINVMTSEAIIVQGESRRTWAVEWSICVCTGVLTVALPVVLSTFIYVYAVPRSGKKSNQDIVLSVISILYF